MKGCQCPERVNKRTVLAGRWRRVDIRVDTEANSRPWVVCGQGWHTTAKMADDLPAHGHPYFDEPQPSESISFREALCRIADTSDHYAACQLANFLLGWTKNGTMRLGVAKGIIRYAEKLIKRKDKAA